MSKIHDVFVDVRQSFSVALPEGREWSEVEDFAVNQGDNNRLRMTVQWHDGDVTKLEMKPNSIWTVKGDGNVMVRNDVGEVVYHD